MFDEADQMLMTEGFKDVSFRMLSMIRKVSPDVQILLFSATFSQRIREYCNKVRSTAPADVLGPPSGSALRTCACTVKLRQVGMATCVCAQLQVSSLTPAAGVIKAADVVDTTRAGVLAELRFAKLAGVQIVPGATRVLIEKEDLSLDVIKQHKVLVQGDHQKADILKSYILRNADKLGQMIVFVRTRRAADALTQVRTLLRRMRYKHSD